MVGQAFSLIKLTLQYTTHILQPKIIWMDQVKLSKDKLSPAGLGKGLG